MKPGRELDALVAEKVMGLAVWYEDDDEDKKFPATDDPYNPEVPAYSTDIAAAWEVVEKIEGADRWLFLSRHSFGWRAVFSSTSNSAPLNAEGKADTAPHAICLAALRAVGVEVDDG